MSLKSLGVPKLTLGETSGTTICEESTGTSGGEIGEGVASLEGADKLGAEDESAGFVESGSIGSVEVGSCGPNEGGVTG